MGRTSLTIGAAALVGSALVLASCGTTGGTDSAPAGGTGCTGTIGYLGPKTGDYANLGLNIIGGVKVALADFKKSNPECTVEFKEFDSQGDPEKSTPLADEISSDKSILAVVGPAFSGESKATGQTFADAGLATITPSATNNQLSKQGWSTFHRILGSDAAQAPAAGRFIKNTLKSQKVFLIDDASEYGKGLADGIKTDLTAVVVGQDTIQAKQTDFSPTVTKVKSTAADTVFYGGYYPEAGLLTKQLREAGWTGTFVAGDGVLDPGYVAAAGGKSAEGAYMTCACAPSAGEFLTKFRQVNKAEPGTYSAEGYDAANVFLQGLAAGKTDRKSMLEWVTSYDRPGLTKEIKFDGSGEVTGAVIYAYQVKNGKLEPSTEIK